MTKGPNANSQIPAQISILNLIPLPEAEFAGTYERISWFLNLKRNFSSKHGFIVCYKQNL
jgi:hypothetical protein